MFESLKNKAKDSNSKTKYKPTKRDAAVAVTVAIVLAMGYAISEYQPGAIVYQERNNSRKADDIKVAEETQPGGPVQTFYVADNGMGPRKTLRKQVQDSGMKLPTGLEGLNLPSTMPNLNARPSAPNLNPSSKIDSTMIYARHAAITDNIKGILNPGFTLERMSEAPTGNESRFVTSFVYSINGNALEKFELMSIAKTGNMSSIMTAKQALDALIEENASINIIENNGDYLIYDFAGNGGYQLGKITVDPQGIYIIGYINMTTNALPSVLKNDWIEKIKAL